MALLDQRDPPPRRDLERPCRPAQHVQHLAAREQHAPAHAADGVEPEDVAHDHQTGRQVDAGRQRRRRGDEPQESFAIRRLDPPSHGLRQPRVVVGDAVADERRQLLERRVVVEHAFRHVAQPAAVCRGQLGRDELGQLAGHLLRRRPRGAEHQRLLAPDLPGEDVLQLCAQVLRPPGLELERNRPVLRPALEVAQPQPLGQLRPVPDHRRERAQAACAPADQEPGEQPLDDGAPIVVGDQVHLVGDHDPGPEAGPGEQRAEALVRGDHDVRRLGRERVAVLTRDDAQPHVGPREEPLEVVVDLRGEGAEGNQVGVDARLAARDGSADHLAADEGLPGAGRRDDDRVPVVQDAGARGTLEEREARGGARRGTSGGTGCGRHAGTSGGSSAETSTGSSGGTGGGTGGIERGHGRITEVGHGNRGSGPSRPPHLPPPWARPCCGSVTDRGR